MGVGGIHWPAELRVSQGLLSSTKRFDHCSKCLDSHSVRSKVYLCNEMDLTHRETILSPLLIGVARIQTRCHPLSHRWHELEFLLLGRLGGPGAHPTSCTMGTGFFPGGKAEGA
jgi:hypothetical protein